MLSWFISSRITFPASWCRDEVSNLQDFFLGTPRWRMCVSTLPPPGSLPWVELLASELPLETPFIHNAWLNPLDSRCHWVWQTHIIKSFFLTNFPAVEVQSILGGAQWKNYTEGEKSLGWPLVLLPWIMGNFCISFFPLQECPTLTLILAVQQ